MRRPMQRHGPTSGDTVSPAPSYAAHRERVVASAFSSVIAVIAAVTLVYAGADLFKTSTDGQWLTYALVLAIPLLGLLLARSLSTEHAEGVALATDLCFTAVLAGRLLLPTTTVSGTALFLSLKLLATAVLFPWHPMRQYISAASTIAFYYAAIILGGRTLDATHQFAGPLIGAVAEKP